MATSGKLADLIYQQCPKDPAGLARFVGGDSLLAIAWLYHVHGFGTAFNSQTVIDCDA